MTNYEKIKESFVKAAWEWYKLQSLKHERINNKKCEHVINATGVCVECGMGWKAIKEEGE